MGSGSTGAAALLEQKKFLGIELDKEYHAIAEKRLHDALNGTLRYREIDKPIFDPAKAGSVAKDPFLDRE